ncbi:MAG: hydrogenase expression protein HupH [Gammaproteobacteria bacterium]|nr:hydrogenase expression protein HupH [Gammaproteobacteria bacterium]
MSIDIRLITPIITKGIRTLEDVRPLERQGLTVSHSLLESGPSSIESEFDEALAVPDSIRVAIEAEHSGVDAIILDCMGDPGIYACREAVSIPVLGAGQTSMHLANMLGHRFSFITVLDRIRPMIDKIIGSYGLKDKYASFQSIDTPVLELSHDLEALNEALSEKALIAIESDGADAIILGCTGFLGCADAIRASLQGRGYCVPVIDPIPAAVHMAEALIKSGLTHSKVSYPEPSLKVISGYSIPKYNSAAN